MPQKPFSMSRTNLVRSNLASLEPLPEMLHNSAVYGRGAAALAATRKITSEGLRIYVKLAICLPTTNAVTPTSLLGHNESGKPPGFSRPRHPSSYQNHLQFKTLKTKTLPVSSANS
jgi:hypothetical protein